MDGWVDDHATASAACVLRLMDVIWCFVVRIGVCFLRCQKDTDADGVQIDGRDGLLRDGLRSVRVLRTRIITNAMSLEIGVPVGMPSGATFWVASGVTRVLTPSLPMRRGRRSSAIDGRDEGDSFFT